MLVIENIISSYSLHSIELQSNTLIDFPFEYFHDKRARPMNIDPKHTYEIKKNPHTIITFFIRIVSAQATKIYILITASSTNWLIELVNADLIGVWVVSNDKWKVSILFI